MSRCMRRTNLHLDEFQTAALDTVARAEGVSRAEVVRRLIDRGIPTALPDLDADLTAIEDSYGVWSEDDLVTREPDTRAAHLNRIRRG